VGNSSGQDPQAFEFLGVEKLPLHIEPVGLGSSALRHVGVSAEYAQGLPVFIPADHFPPIQDPFVRPVLAKETMFTGVEGGLTRKVPLDFPVDVFLVFGVNPAVPFIEVICDFMFLVSQHRFPLGREVHLSGLSIPVPKTVSGPFQGELPPQVAFPQGLFGSFAFGHVVSDAQDFQEISPVVPDGFVAPGDPGPFPVSANVLVFLHRVVFRVSDRIPQQGAQVSAAVFLFRQDGSKDALAQDLRLGVPEKAFRIFIEEGDSPLGIQAKDDAVGVLNQLAIFLLASSQGRFRPPSTKNARAQQHDKEAQGRNDRSGDPYQLLVPVIKGFGEMEDLGAVRKGSRGDMEPFHLSVVEHGEVCLPSPDHRDPVGTFPHQYPQTQLGGRFSLVVPAHQLAPDDAVTQVDVPERVGGNGTVPGDPPAGFPVHELVPGFILEQAVDEDDGPRSELLEFDFQLLQGEVVPKEDLELAGKLGEGGGETVPIGLVGRHRGAADDDDFPGLGVELRGQLNGLENRNLLRHPGDLPVPHDHGRMKIVNAAEHDGNLGEKLLPELEQEGESAVVGNQDQVRGKTLQLE